METNAVSSSMAAAGLQGRVAPVPRVGIHGPGCTVPSRAVPPDVQGSRGLIAAPRLKCHYLYFAKPAPCSRRITSPRSSEWNPRSPPPRSAPPCRGAMRPGHRRSARPPAALINLIRCGPVAPGPGRARPELRGSGQRAGRVGGARKLRARVPPPRGGPRTPRTPPSGGVRGGVRGPPAQPWHQIRVYYAIYRFFFSFVA